MPDGLVLQSAEIVFEQAWAAWLEQDYQVASQGFALALKLMPDTDLQYNLYLGYYGLSCVLLNDAAGLKFCRRAGHFERYDANVFYLLAMAESRMGSRTGCAMRSGPGWYWRRITRIYCVCKKIWDSDESR